MTPHERKLLKQTVALGVAITAIVVLLDWMGGIEPLERWLYDTRVARFQMFLEPPTDELVHLNITDSDLNTIGLPPWPRRYFAVVTDELTRAGAKAIAYDLIFSEPDRDAPENDLALAESMRASGICLLPISFDILEKRSTVQGRIAALLRDDLELTTEEVAARLTEEGVDFAAMTTPLNDLFLRARARVMQDRVVEAMTEDPTRDFDALRTLLLPRHQVFLHGSPALTLLRDTIDQAKTIRNLQALGRREALPAGVQPVPASLRLLPISQFSATAATTGFVEYPDEDDGVMRRIPLWMVDRGHVYPHFGLALVCMHLGVDIRDVRIEPERVIIPMQDRDDIVIPTHQRLVGSDDEKVRITGVMDLPFFGTSGTNDWITMLDYPEHKVSRNHMPYMEVWKIQHGIEQIRRNNAEADRAIVDVMAELADPDFGEKYNQNRPPLDDFNARIEPITVALKNLQEMVFDLVEDPASLSEVERQWYDESARTGAVLERVRQENSTRLAEIDQWRENLREKVQGKSVIIGWTATAVAADFVPTPLHGKCPGPIVHGVAFNAILNGELWSRSPGWLNVTLMIIAGLIGLVLVAFTGPQASSVALVAIGGAYFLFNGLVLFDYGNFIVPAAAPLVALAGTWSGTTVWRFVVERRERNRITSRFASYVDPKLVQYVLEHEDQDIFAGQDLEMTVVFTDLAGFTTLSEALREGIVGILNDYIKLVVPIIEKHHGFVNKFLGDGVMFFYGAPYPNPDHARDSMITAFEMQEALLGFNEALVNQGLPTVRMRVGINTGQMIVGDAGGVKRSDYTVLGDSVNLSARLESANKQTGTLMMISQRTLDLMGDDFLVRPLGSLQVMGKTEGVAVYEPLAMPGQATEKQRHLAQLTSDLIEAYKAARFDACIEAADALDAFTGEPTKLAKLYRELCEHFKANPPEMPFHGDIVLTSK